MVHGGLVVLHEVLAGAGGSVPPVAQACQHVHPGPHGGVEKIPIDVLYAEVQEFVGIQVGAGTGHDLQVGEMFACRGSERVDGGGTVYGDEEDAGAVGPGRTEDVQPGRVPVENLEPHPAKQVHLV